ncbi:MAG: 3'(2'),5'-bisphosphate nucleotidase [Planctomycetes bacterium]|nr:3'(2'),5'-bisphosphate nucleotidase [Planctomycetota bacterium]
MSASSAEFDREGAVAIASVAAAAHLCQRVQRRRVFGAALTKGDKSPVTVADFGAQAVVCRALELAFPHDPVMGEEDAAELRDSANAAIATEVVGEVREQVPEVTASAVLDHIDRATSDGGGGRFWCLDPIDGTKGFLRGEQYAVALALLVDGVVRVGALACPNLPFGGAPGCIVAAVRGRGTRVLPWPGDERIEAASARVSPVSDGALARIVESVEAAHGDHGSHDRVRATLRCTTESVRLDSQAKYAVLARGDGDVYLRMPTSVEYRENLWDQAAGSLVIEEAGGRVTDVDGRALDFTRGRKLTANQGIVATNGALHAAVLAAIRTIRS